MPDWPCEAAAAGLHCHAYRCQSELADISPLTVRSERALCRCLQYCEIYAPQIKDFVEVSDKTYTKADMLVRCNRSYLTS